MATIAEVRTSIQRAAAGLETLALRDGTDNAVADDNLDRLAADATSLADHIDQIANPDDARRHEGFQGWRP